MPLLQPLGCAYRVFISRVIWPRRRRRRRLFFLFFLWGRLFFVFFVFFVQPRRKLVFV